MDGATEPQRAETRRWRGRLSGLWFVDLFSACAGRAVNILGRLMDALTNHRRSRVFRAGMRWTGLVVLGGTVGLLAAALASAETVFLQDGRTIQADKVEIIGDRVHIEKPAGTIEIPRSEVLSVHPTAPPSGTPGSPSPADTYRDIGQQMNDRLRREIESRPGASGSK
jgi:hypothetical protein